MLTVDATDTDPAADHQVEVGQLTTRCRVWGSVQAAERMRGTLERTLQRRLPLALERAVEPVLDGLDGVVRVRQLQLQLDLELGETLDGAAELLADRVAALLRRVLLSDSPDVLTWADHEAYVATYLGRRLRLCDAPAWPFEDLASLDHLPAERAAAEVCLRRPEVLRRLARVAGAATGPEEVVSGWPVVARARLGSALVLETEAPTAHELRAAVALVRAHLPTPPRTLPAEPTTALAVRLALRCLATSPLGTSAVAVVVAALASLVPRRDGAAGERQEGAAAAGTSDAVDDDERAVRRAQELLDDLRPTTGRRGGERRSWSPATGDARPRAAEDRDGPVRTAYAGLALLVPSVLGLGAPALLGATRLAQVVWQTLEGDDREAVAHDPALAHVFPVDPHELDPAWEQPDPPERLVAWLCGEARPGYLSAAASGEAWSALLLGDLACRLPGLRGSSAAYLRDQFLLRPGTVTRAPGRVTVRLDPVPLGIVLQMAGHGSAPQRLPHAGDRWFELDLGSDR